MSLTKTELAYLISITDHTYLKRTTPEQDRQNVIKLCDEATVPEIQDCHVAAVCIYDEWTPLAAIHLRDTEVKVANTIDFPEGTGTPEKKAELAEDAINKGAQELDLVLNTKALRKGNYGLVKKGIGAVIEKAGTQIPVKVIYETPTLTDNQIIKACDILNELYEKYPGVQLFGKTSTGFGTPLAQMNEYELLGYIEQDGSHLGDIVKRSGLASYECKFRLEELCSAEIGLLINESGFYTPTRDINTKGATPHVVGLLGKYLICDIGEKISGGQKIPEKVSKIVKIAKTKCPDRLVRIGASSFLANAVDQYLKLKE